MLIITITKSRCILPDSSKGGDKLGARVSFTRVLIIINTKRRSERAGYEILVGKFPFTASGKATAAGSRDGFIKIIIDAKTDLILGAHLCGDNVTEMIAGLVVARQNGLTAKQVAGSVHPHPTLSEAIMEAIEQAYGKAVHL